MPDAYRLQLLHELDGYKNELPTSQSDGLKRLLDAYEESLKISGELSPSSDVNRIFSIIVEICLHRVIKIEEVQSMKPHIKDGLIRQCLAAESSMERHWAGFYSEEFRKHPPKNTEETIHVLEQFWYFQNYQDIGEYEVDSIQNFAKEMSNKFFYPENIEKVAFIGSGPLPLSAILLLMSAHHFPEAHWTLIDIDDHAHKMAQSWIELSGVPLDRISYCTRDVMELQENEISSFDVVFLAATVGGSESQPGTSKKDIINHLADCMRPDSILTARTAVGTCALLYHPIKKEDLEYRFKFVRGFDTPKDTSDPEHPKERIVNSVFIATSAQRGCSNNAQKPGNRTLYPGVQCCSNWRKCVDWLVRMGLEARKKWKSDRARTDQPNRIMTPTTYIWKYLRSSFKLEETPLQRGLLLEVFLCNKYSDIKQEAMKR